MNGRIYDPLLGRFLSADIMVQFPYDLQSYNRYSYCRNNPLSKTDPSGFADQQAGDPAAEAVEEQTTRLRSYAADPAHTLKDFGRAVGENAKVSFTKKLDEAKIDTRLKIEIPLNDPKNASLSGTVSNKPVDLKATVSKENAKGEVTITLPSGAKMTTTAAQAKAFLDKQVSTTQVQTSPQTSTSTPTTQKPALLDTVTQVIGDVATAVVNSVVPNAFNSAQIPGTPATLTVGAKPALAVTVGNTTVKVSTDLNKAQESMKKDDGSLAAEMQRKKEEEEKKKKQNP